MLAKVHDHIYLSDQFGCSKHSPGYMRLSEKHATVHAAKDPCHRIAVGYERKLPDTHPNYLVKEDALDLYLNMIDPLAPLFKHELFWAATEFIDKHIANLPVVIHCSAGHSRAPSIYLVYAASKRILPQESYDQAAYALTKQYPEFNPNSGVREYIRTHWGELISGRPLQTPAA